MNRGLIQLVILGAWSSLCLGGGVWLTATEKNAELSRLKAAWAQEKAATEAIVRHQLQAEKARGDFLSDRLAKAESFLNKQTQEVSRAIPRVTSGRPCLDGAAVRLLNHTDGGPGPSPEAPGPSTAEDGAAATDTDVAGWINAAQGQYETCRARLGALIDFENGEEE